ncbi:tripartite tricarboxylate transporter TctB family protein [Brucellaceae bacterium VT-16-1752]|nr:tripartite tricarboxylate transporter TctB family protein [Brucellaceae bacterium VT-16-1752]
MNIRWRMSGDRAFGAIAVVTAATLILARPDITAAMEGEPGPAYFPIIVAAFLAVLGAALIIAPQPTAPESTNADSPMNWGALIAFSVLTVGYAAIFTPLGYRIATILYLTVASFMLGERSTRSILRSVIFAVISTMIFGLALTQLFGAFLPEATFL